MSNSIQLSCLALWYLIYSLFQGKFTGGAYPPLHTSQELLKFPFSAAGYHISISLWAGLAELKVSSVLTSLSQCLGDKAGHFLASTLTHSSDATRPSRSPPSAYLTVPDRCRPPSPALNKEAFGLGFHEASVPDLLCFHSNSSISVKQNQISGKLVHAG